MQNIAPIAIANSSSELNLTNKSLSAGSVCEVCNYLTALPDLILAMQLVFPSITFIANSVTFVAIWRARELKPSMRLSLLNLSVTDIMASLLYIYQIAFAWTVFDLNEECIIRYALFVASVVLTMQTILFMSVDRFISITVPYVYAKLDQNKAYVPAAITFCWIWTTVHVSVSFFFTRSGVEGCFYPMLLLPEVNLASGILSLSHFVSVAVLNIAIFVQAKIQITKIASTLVGEEKDRQIARLGLKAAMTTVAVVVPYIITNVPLYFLLIYFYYNVDFTLTSKALLVLNGLSSLCLVNSLINPSIYIWRLKPVRDELRKLRILRAMCLNCKVPMWNRSKKNSKTSDTDP